ncbi:MauE/DoxX family redox-associated membrane protein [Rothia nasimurium]|uniref:MauE/DoxX family redox-associated membrane protein n=1 Tax=Rothia nasimurium TaxID=85336 RepID=UPI00301438C6
MVWLAFGGALVVVLTLLVSGVAKACQPHMTVGALVALRLHSYVPVKWVARLLPWVELGLAGVVLLASGVFAVVGATATLGLMLVFWLVVARALALGATEPCQCFGGLSSAPLSWRTLVRNTFLVACAAATLYGAATYRGGVLALLPHLLA